MVILDKDGLIVHVVGLQFYSLASFMEALQTIMIQVYRKKCEVGILDCEGIARESPWHFDKRKNHSIDLIYTSHEAGMRVNLMLLPPAARLPWTPRAPCSRPH